MTEDQSKVIDRRRLRSLRMAAKKSKTEAENDPSAVAITTATSTGIEASLPDNLDAKGSSHGDPSAEGNSSSRKLKKKKKNNSSADESVSKSKKKKKDVIAESLKATTSKVPSLFPTSPKKKKKNKSSSSDNKDSSETKKKKGKAKKYKELEDGNSDSEDNQKGTSSFDSPLPISTSKSRSERDEGSLRDIKIANPVDKSVSKRGSTSSQLKLDLGLGSLGSLPTFGDSTIDDDETPFWKKNSGGSRRNSPIPSLEEDDTILTNDEANYFKFNKLESKGPKQNNTPVSPPPLSDEDDSAYESSSDESSSSSDGEPEWQKKKKMFETKGAKVAYKPPPPPKEPEKPANEEEKDDDEPPKESLPPWANARKALKKTGSKRTTVSPTPAIKEKVEAPKKEEEQDPAMAGLPSWALPKVKKTASARNVTKTNVENDKTEKVEEKENGKEAPKVGVPSWAQNNRTSLKKTGSTRNTTAPSAKDSEKTAEPQKDENDGDSDAAAKAGVPAWANARKSLKKSASSRRNTAETVPADTGNPEEEKQNEKTGSESDNKPVWAKKKTVSARKVTAPADPLPPAADESDNKPVWAKKKTLSARKITAPADPVAPAADESDNKPVWAKKKTVSARKVTAPADPAPPPTKTTEPESNKSDGVPPWATARSSLRSSSTRSLKAAPREEQVQNPETEKDKEDLPKAKSLHSSGSRPSSGGVPSWAKKKPAASEESSDELAELKGEGGDEKPKIEDNADSKGEKAATKSVKERLSLWGNSNQSKPPKAMSERNVASSAGVDASSSRKAKIGKAQSERSISGSVSVTSQGSQDSQGTNSHRNRMAAYLGNSRSEHKNDTSKPPIAPVGKNREQSGSESLDKTQKQTNTNVTPQKSNVRRGPPRTSSGNLSVKERTKAWGTSSQNSRDGDASSVGTGGALSGADPDDDEEKSVPSVKDRMKAWNQTTTAKSSQGIPTKVAITTSSDQNEADSETLKPPSQFTDDENPNTKSDHSRSSETDSYGRSKAKTWSAKPSPVPAYAAVALKKVKKDPPSSDGNDSKATPQLTRMYSSDNLKKVNPAPTENTSSVPPETIEPAKQKRPSFRREMSNSSSFHSRSQSNKSSSDVDKNENNNDDKPPIYATKLRKVAPPDASKWKSKKDTMGGSSHGASSLRKVEKPNEQKWKDKKSADTEDEAIPRASLRKVSPPVEKKWKSPKTHDEEAGKLYSSQHERLRKVKPPIQEKGKGSDNASESPTKPESDVSHLQSFNKTLVVLISSVSGSQEQKSAQDRALTILKGMEIGPSQMETVDGADPKNKERRNELFGISGVRGNYPQFFLVDSNDKTTFLSDWEGFESMHEMKTLSESMNLTSSSKDLDAESHDSSENSADEFACEEETSSETLDQKDAKILEQTPLINVAGEMESTVEAGKSVASDDDVKLCVEEEGSVEQGDVKEEIMASDSDETASVSNVHGGEAEVSIAQENDLSKNGLGDDSKDADADEGESLAQEDKSVPKNDEPCIENDVDGGEKSTQDAEISAQEDEPQLASIAGDDAKKNESDSDGSGDDQEGKEQVQEEGSQLPETNDATSDDVKVDNSNDSNDVVEEKDDSEQSSSSSDSEDESSDDDEEEEEQSVPEKYADNEEKIDRSEEKEIDSPTIEDDNDENESTPDKIVKENGSSNSDTGRNKAVDGDEESDGTDTPHRWNEQSSIADSSEGGALEETTATAIASSPASISPDENVANEESTDSNHSETVDDADANEVEVPVNFGREVPVNFGRESEDAVEKSKAEGIMKILEDSFVFDEDAPPISLTSFFSGEKEASAREGNSGERLEKLRTHSSHSNDNGSDKKPMSVRSLSDHLSRDLSNDNSRGTNGFQSETSPVDEESSGGWSDDDSATIKSEITDITYGTLGSAVVVDATAMTTKVDAAKKLRRMVAAKAAASTEDIVPGLPPNLPPLGKPKASATSKSQKGSLPAPSPPKASSGGEILFTPPRPLTESYESDSDNDGDNKKAGKATKKKKKKKPKKAKESSSVDRDIDFSAGMLDDGGSPKKDKKRDKKKKKERKKVATVQEDIVFDFGAEDDAATERSKKRKKKKKRKEDSGSGEDSQ